MRALRDKAGLDEIDVAPFETPMLLAGGGTVDDTIEFLLATATARAMFEHAAPGAKARAVDAVRAALAAYHDQGSVRLTAAMWVVAARKTDWSSVMAF